MRGQAFIAFENKDTAAKAKKEVDKFPLYGKPMVSSLLLPLVALSNSTGLRKTDAPAFCDHQQQIQFAKTKSDAVVEKQDKEALASHKESRKMHKGTPFTTNSAFPNLSKLTVWILLLAPFYSESPPRQPAGAEEQAQAQTCFGRGGRFDVGRTGGQEGRGHDARRVPAAERDSVCAEPHGWNRKGGAGGVVRNVRSSCLVLPCPPLLIPLLLVSGLKQVRRSGHRPNDRRPKGHRVRRLRGRDELDGGQGGAEQPQARTGRGRADAGHLRKEVNGRAAGGLRNCEREGKKGVLYYLLYTPNRPRAVCDLEQEQSAGGFPRRRDFGFGPVDPPSSSTSAPFPVRADAHSTKDHAQV